MNGDKKHLSIAFVSLILGLLLALQFRVSLLPKPAAAPDHRVQELAAQLLELDKEKESLAADVSDLEEKVQTARQGVAQTEEALSTEVAKHRTLAGFTEVTGPGVIITLQNIPQEGAPDADPALFAIRDTELLRVVNDLWGEGAEAVAVNGQRLAGTSEIRQAGPYINVNLRRISPPYEIRAIGNPDALRHLLEASGGLVEQFAGWGIEVRVEVGEKLALPACNSPMSLKYARPHKEGD